MSGNPIPAITWDRDGIPVTANDRVAFSDNNMKLQIDGLLAEDAGLYTCTAIAEGSQMITFPTGNDTQSFLLVVQGKRNFRVTHIQQ